MTTKQEFELEFRTVTGYNEQVFSNVDFETTLQRAAKHVRSRKGLSDDFSLDDFLSDSDAEEALFWWTCLFAKVETGELDSQDLQVGAVDGSTLLAKADDDVTQWYRNAMTALRGFRPGEKFIATGPNRDNRVYGQDTTGGNSLTNDL